VTRGLHWFRNDLRLRDNTALAEATRRCDRLAAVFVFDDAILKSPRTGAPRVRFLLACLEKLGTELVERGIPLWIRHGDPARELGALLEEQAIDLLSFNRDTTPLATRRDAQVREAAASHGVEVVERRDRVVFEAAEVRTRQGGPFSVFTPYSRRWRECFAEDPRRPQRAPRLPAWGKRVKSDPLPDAGALGFAGDETTLPTAGEDAARRRLKAFLEERVERYGEDRDVPSIDGTSRLSPHLRFGTVSVRDCLAAADEAAAARPKLGKGVEKWSTELIWREFYAALLEEHPRVTREEWKIEFAKVQWDDAPDRFEAWCQGRTGYPFVDAGMRQLLETGWMHNRVRMVVASFLTKDLLIDWRRGEEWFLQRLLDGDPASNNGGWQWAASTGADAAPYFRIFNPVTQGERFDPEGEYVRRFVPELSALKGKSAHRPWDSPMLAPDYPERIVDHAEQREEALARFQAVKESHR
jgi:deoxyribodipyrimidine photo-lyase